MGPVLLLLCCWWTLATFVAAQDENSTWDGCCSSSYVPYYDYVIVEVDYLGDNITLNCSENDIHTTRPGDAVPIGWMLPDLRLYGVNDSDSKYQVSSDAYTLTIRSVYQEDFGLYHCMLRYFNYYDNATRLWMAKYGINTEGPYYEDLWEKYDLNTLIALSAFFGWLLLCLVIWVLWYFRWIPPEDEASSCTGTYNSAFNTMEENGMAGAIPSKELDAQSPNGPTPSYKSIEPDDKSDDYTVLADGSKIPADDDIEQSIAGDDETEQSTAL